MSLSITLRTAARILRQLRHDHRTVAMLVLIPTLLLILLRYVFDARPEVFDRVGLILLGVLPFTMMFMVTSIAVLRERTSGTLERLLTTPMSKLDLLLGYGLAFAIAGALQSTLAAAVAYGVLGLDTEGSPLLVAAIAVVNAIMGMAMGLFVSAFAVSEFQAVQFMPAVVMPQALLCGLIAPREEMAGLLRSLSDLMPLSYAVEALGEVGANAGATTAMWTDIGVIIAVALVALALGAATLQRRSA